MANQNKCTHDQHKTGHQYPIVLIKVHRSPGNYVSVDQYISSVPGHLTHTKGKNLTNKKFFRGTIFVDQASSYVYIQNEVDLTAGKTLLSNKAFEKNAGPFDVNFKGFLAKNVTVGLYEFIWNIMDNKETLYFCGNRCQ